MTMLSKVVHQAEWAANKRALRVYTWTQDNGSHVIDIVFRDGTRKEMHAPAGELEMDWEVSQDNLRWQKRMADDIL